jgi:hypothetical protein
MRLAAWIPFITGIMPSISTTSGRAARATFTASSARGAVAAIRWSQRGDRAQLAMIAYETALVVPGS